MQPPTISEVELRVAVYNRCRRGLNATSAAGKDQYLQEIFDIVRGKKPPREEKHAKHTDKSPLRQNIQSGRL